MNKKEVTEIKRRFKKEACTFDRMAGCYVDANKDMVLTFNQTFLNLEDEEFYKYLELANKCLSGVLGNNLLELGFPTHAEVEGGGHDLLMQLRESRLSDEKMLMEYYQRIIDTYDYVGNYLIVLFHDTYDIPIKTTDEMMLDDSEEVFDYIIGAICPVTLSKPALGYKANENKIGARERDWVVNPTDTGFTFPCFTERSTDLHSVMVYAKNAKEPHCEFWENCLGCETKKTSTQKKNAFTNMVTKAIGDESDESIDTALDIQKNLSDFIEYEEEKLGKDTPVILTSEDVADILTDSGLSDTKVASIKTNYENYFGEELPEACELLDEKSLKNNEIRLEKKVLQEKVVDLTNQLKDAGVISDEGKGPDIIIKVSDAKLSMVETGFVDGKKSIIIPLEPDDTAMLNGSEM